ncbi:hypothetical protein Leryth_012448 [Lithospermum erythrorhizon]|nr:hypothetical protein Leryth_012448 [Lithospermum erythrorhizon]
MRRNCNLELRLVPPSLPFNPSGNDSPSNFMLDSFNDIFPTKQQLTIFYNGKTAVCDVTELQARSIISLASQEMEDRSLISSSSPTTPLVQSLTPSPTGLSMKRSLKRFLEKRKNRAQAASPYHQN